MDKKIIIIITIIIILGLFITAFFLFSNFNNTFPQKTCALECDKYHYSTCPKGCVKTCLPSVCSGDICTDDCDGPGSCACL